MTFNALCQKLIDAWVASGQDQEAQPEHVYQVVAKQISIRSRLSLIEVESEDPRQWVLHTIRHSQMTNRLLNLDVIFSGGRLGDIADQAYIERSVVPSYTRAIELQTPILDAVETKILGVKVIYDRIILPQKGRPRPQWLVVCTYGRFMARVPPSVHDIDPTDEAIIISLIEGMTSKEIALEVGISHRTVEHRLERMKKQIGARSLPHLVALLVSAGFDRSLRPRD